MTSRRGKRLLWVLLLAIGVAIVLVSVTPNFIRCRCQSPLTACKSNLKHIGTALEMYSTDHSSYPNQLAELTPNYLKAVPTCPSGKSYGAEISGEEYLVYCSGGWHGKTLLSDTHSSKSHTHSKTAPGSPAYSSHEGLLADKILFTVEGSNRKSDAYWTACKNILASTLAVALLLGAWRTVRRRYISRSRTPSEL